MENSLDKIINNLKQVIEITGIEVNENVLFEQSVKMYLSNQIQSSKEKNIATMKSNSPKEEMPTEKQIAFLKKNKYKGELPKTKEEAKKIISDYLERRNTY